MTYVNIRMDSHAPLDRVEILSIPVACRSVFFNYLVLGIKSRTTRGIPRVVLLCSWSRTCFVAGYEKGLEATVLSDNPVGAGQWQTGHG